MRRIVTLIAVLAMTLGMAGVASASEHGHPWPEHGHILLLGLQFDDSGEPVGFRKCVDIAGGRKNDHAHHTTLHQGRAGVALQRAGHAIVPTADLTPWANCAEFIEALESGELD